MHDSEISLELKKLQSLSAFKQSGLPILKYKVLEKNNYRGLLETFLKENNLTKFMVRTDGKGNFSPSILNTTANIDTLKKIEAYFKEGFTVFAMENANIYKSFHSLNILLKENTILVEAVGQGFIATDLNRGGYLHECLEIIPKTGKLIRTYIVSNNTYQEDRHKKISNFNIEELKTNDAYLISYNEYVPISDDEIKYVIKSIEQLRIVENILVKERGNSLLTSMSFTNLGNGKDEPIFWDAYCIK